MTARGPAEHVAIEALLEQRDWVRALARSLYLDKNRADDVEQETWRMALERPPRHAQSLRAWFGKAVRNAAHTAGRKERTRSAREAAAVPREPSPSPEDAVAAAELQTKLARAVLELDEPYRTTVVLRYFEGLESAQIAARLRVPVETVRTRVKRAIARLREHMGLDLRDDPDAWCLLVFGVRAADVKPGTLLWSGGMVMATAKTYVAAAAVLAFCAGVWWWSRDDGAAAAPHPSNAEVAKAKTDAPVRPRRAREETPEAAVTNVETAVPAPAAVLPGASVHLRFVDDTGAVLSPEATRARWGGGFAAPSVALFDDRALRSANRSDWLRQMVGGTAEALHPAPLAETPDVFALKDRIPRGRWRLVVFPGAASSTLTRPFTVAKDGDAIDVDVVLAAVPMRLVRLTDCTTHAAIAGARLVPYFEFGDDGAFVAGSAMTADSAGEARLPVETGDRKIGRRPPTWWATAPGRVASFIVRSESDAPMEVSLIPTFDVEGDAFLADGSPAAGRKVCWSRKGYSISAMCDAAGHFRLAGLPAAAPSQQQIFLLDDAGRGVRSATVEAKPGGTATVRFDAPAAGSARVVVRVTAGGLPVPGMAVTCRGREGRAMVLTDADGTATLTDFASGAQPTVIVLLCDPRVAQDFTAAGPQPPLAAGEERKLTLDLPAGAVRVRVVSADGSPVPGAHVIARSGDESAVDPKGKPLTPSPEGWAVKFGDARFADDDGAALLTGLPAGAACEVSATDGVAGLEASASVVPGTTGAPAELTLVLK